VRVIPTRIALILTVNPINVLQHASVEKLRLGRTQFLIDHLRAS